MTDTAKNSEVVKHAGFYSLASFLTQLVTIIAAFLSRLFLGPAQIGIWSMTQIVLAYANYSNLGTLDAMYREIPFNNGKGEHKKADSLKNTTFTFSIVAAVFISLCVILYALYMRKTLHRDIFYGLLFTAVMIILQRINAVLLMVVYAYKRFSLASKLTLYSAIVNAVFIAILSYRYKLFGFMIAMILSFIFNIFFIFSAKGFNFRFSLNLKDLRGLLSYGFPIMLLGLASTFFETLDKLIITKSLGLEALGLYGIAQMTYTYIFSIPNSISIVVTPNMHEKFGQTEEKKELLGYLEKSSYFYSNIIPVFIGLGWFLVPYLVELLLPKFRAGIPAIKFLVLGSFFYAVGQGCYVFIYVIRKHLVLFPMLALVSAVAFVLDWGAIRMGWGITGVAVATSLAIFLQFTLYYFYSAWHVYSFVDGLKKYMSVVLKFMWMLSLLFLLSEIRLASHLLTAVIQITLYTAIYIPFLWGINQRFGLWTLLRSKFVSKKNAQTLPIK